jgi:L-alanine-DL-glutamate epimerase-like enolase superfamily enzyme
MVNIKLDKTGGLTEALALAQEAERRDLNGCWAACSAPRGRSARAAAGAAGRFADLDGPTWLAVDVEPALHFSTGVLHL